MGEVQDYLISQELKAAEQLAEIIIKKALPTMLDLAKGMAKWISGQSGGKKTGQQTLQQLTKYGESPSEIPLNSDNIKSFTSIARKHGVAFALVEGEIKPLKRTGDGEQDADRPLPPPCHTVYFKAKDTESMTAAFKEYMEKEMDKGKSQTPTFKQRMEKAKDKSRSTNKDKNNKRDVEGR